MESLLILVALLDYVSIDLFLLTSSSLVLCLRENG